MQQVWRKRWQNSAWVAVAAITLVLLGGAVYKKNHSRCTGIEVAFRGDANFIDEKVVLAVLREYGDIKRLPLESIDLKALEAKLEHDTWIANAELFFDNKQVLQVSIEEKQPIARIFTTAGTSFYIDSACIRLPLSDKLTARIPVFTSFPTERERMSKFDSGLFASVRELAMFIQHDEFWKAQVEQIDITPEGFEMIPMIGSHSVELGKGGDWQRKFDRLFSFYKQVWTKVGFEKYECLNVQFEGQIVAKNRGAKPSVVDSAKAKAAYETLLAEVKWPTVDTAPLDNKVKAVVNDKSADTKSISIKPTLAGMPKTVMIKVDTAKIAALKIANVMKGKAKTPVPGVVRSNANAVSKPTVNSGVAAAKPTTGKATNTNTGSMKPATRPAAAQESHKSAVNRQGVGPRVNSPADKQAPKATMKKN